MNNNEQNVSIEELKRIRHRAKCKAYRESNKEKIKAWKEANREKIKEKRKEYREANKEKIKKKHNEWYMRTKEVRSEKRKAQCKAWREANKEKKKEMDRKYREANKEKIKETFSEWYIRNKEIHNEKCKEYRKLNSDKIKEWKIKNKDKKREYQKQYNKKRKQEDSLYAMQISLRLLIRHAFKRIGKNKPVDTLTQLGCTWLEAKAHFESLFQEGMTWENHGTYGWHIDHIRPVSSFPIEELHLANHISNLQPLWAADNLKKGNKFNH
jgi:hypothetical protein